MELGYLIFVETHQPIYDVIDIVCPLEQVFPMVWRVSKVDTRYALLLPPLAELSFVIE